MSYDDGGIDAFSCEIFRIENQRIDREEIKRLEQQLASLNAQLAEKDKELIAIAEKLSCHRAFIMQEINTLQDITKDIPNIDRLRQAEAELVELREKMQGIEEVYSLLKPMEISDNTRHVERIMWQAITQAVEGK